MEQISFVCTWQPPKHFNSERKKKNQQSMLEKQLGWKYFSIKKNMIIILQFLRLPHDTSSADRDSDFNLTNSFATSSFVLCERMRKIVQPVSSRWTLLPRWHQHAQLPFSTMSRNCNTATPISRSSRAKQ